MKIEQSIRDLALAVCEEPSEDDDWECVKASNLATLYAALLER